MTQEPIAVSDIYFKTFNSILNKQIIEPFEEKFISIEYRSFYGENGIEEEFDIFLIHDEERYAIDFVPIDEIIALKLTKETINDFDIPNICAHLLYELTFWGDEEETERRRKELFGRTLRMDSFD